MEPLFLGIGLAAGVLSGLFGIGGGILIVPALIFFAKFPAKLALGTSLGALLLPVGLLGAYTYYRTATSTSGPHSSWRWASSSAPGVGPSWPRCCPPPRSSACSRCSSLSWRYGSGSKQGGPDEHRQRRGPDPAHLAGVRQRREDSSPVHLRGRRHLSAAAMERCAGDPKLRADHGRPRCAARHLGALGAVQLCRGNRGADAGGADAARAAIRGPPRAQHRGRHGLRGALPSPGQAPPILFPALRARHHAQPVDPAPPGPSWSRPWISTSWGRES